MDLQSVGRILLSLGLMMVVFGLILTFMGKIPGLGRLPGDIYVKRGSVTFYFPLATCIILSIILSVILNLIRRR